MKRVNKGILDNDMVISAENVQKMGEIIALTELENLISQYDVEIIKEKARSYTFLTADDIEMYLSKFVFENADDIKVRKLIVNAFIREVILYNDEIVITYNFTDSPEHLKLTKEHVVKTEKEIETADKTAVSSDIGSYKLCHTAPTKKQPCKQP